REDHLGETRIAEKRPPQRLLGDNELVLELLVSRKIADESENQRDVRFRSVANFQRRDHSLAVSLMLAVAAPAVRRFVVHVTPEMIRHSRLLDVLYFVDFVYGVAVLWLVLLS